MTRVTVAIAPWICEPQQGAVGAGGVETPWQQVKNWLLQSVTLLINLGHRSAHKHTKISDSQHYSIKNNDE